MIPGIAWKNFYRQGIRAFLNVLVTALTIIALIFMLSLLNGFQAQATRNMVTTDMGGGQYRVPGFDILTPTEWEDRTLQVPAALHHLSSSEKAEVLIQQGQLFPNRRLYPVQLRGMEMKQSLLDLPLAGLKAFDPVPGDTIPVVVGTRMADKAHLKKGSVVVLKWRDRNNVVDARHVLVVDVADFINPRVDEGVVWARLDHLRSMTARAGEVSWVAVREFRGAVPGMEFHTVEMLMGDLLALLKQDRRNSRILWAILMFLAGTSVFNTQILNVFKRQKEIGTLMALGMDVGKIVRVFTLEGSFAALGAVVLAAVLGIPFFMWFQSVGLDVSHLSASTMPVRERVFLDIQFWEVITSVSLVVVLMILVAWWPVKKISRLDPTLALRGRGIS
ncbi:lipoprotein releasing system transmembrane-like protein [Candidatus Nitromaritima sp. SCGC AAA799-C22]|nr:lipoprotein releasing system transmembrane-like protein [Candidatus Nitromaritima sp. SCGC AAA799-C22]